MDPADQLQVIQLLEEKRKSRRTTVNWLAWASVAMAAVILSGLIAGASRRLATISQQVDDKQRELKTLETRLGTTLRQLDNAEAQITKAQVDLDRGDVEAAVDSLRTPEATPPGVAPPPSIGSGEDRGKIILDLFDERAATRVQAYNALLPKLRRDETLIPQLIAAALAQPQNSNGIYNTLVVLSHMDKDALAPHATELRDWAPTLKRAGPRVSQRVDILLRRLG